MPAIEIFVKNCLPLRVETEFRLDHHCLWDLILSKIPESKISFFKAGLLNFLKREDALGHWVEIQHPYLGKIGTTADEVYLLSNLKVDRTPFINRFKKGIEIQGRRNGIEICKIDYKTSFKTLVTDTSGDVWSHDSMDGARGTLRKIKVLVD